MEEDFQSLSKGVFVVPFRPLDEKDPGPSKPNRRLSELFGYFDIYQAAHEGYEASRTSEQLDDVADWLDRCAVPPLLRKSFPIYRLPIAVIQHISASLPPLLSTLVTHVLTLHARDAMDLVAAVRAVAVGFVGEAALAAKKTGRTGIDEVERWWKEQKDRSPLLLHIQQPQLIPNAVLEELIYIFTLHPKLPLRLLLSVPSITTFISSWTHIEPSAVDLSILQAGKARNRGSAINAILKTGKDPMAVPLTISDRLAEQMYRQEAMIGEGATGALKALRWLLVRHSVSSPLANLDMTGEREDKRDDDDHLSELQAILDAVQRKGASDVPGGSMLNLDPHPDLLATLDPAPRISILHALSQPTAFAPPFQVADVHVDGGGLEEQEVRSPSPSIRKSGRKGAPVRKEHAPSRRQRRPRQDMSQSTSPSPVITNRDTNGRREADLAERGDLHELETLFGLWKAAGRSVNLWDWLEGFRSATLEATDVAKPVEKTSAEVEPPEAETNGTTRKSRRKREAATSPDDQTLGHEEMDEETSARLQAIFIRFCEEARMLGLVRSRGKGIGRRGDEVVRGILMV